MDYLLMIDEYKSHYVYIKVFTNLCSTEQNKKKTCVKVLYSALAVKLF